MKTPTTPSTPFAHSASATAPIHLDISIPLVLLGSKDLNTDPVPSPEHPNKSLELLHTTLLTATGLPIALWQDTPFPSDPPSDPATQEPPAALAARKHAWQRSEEERWAAFIQSATWILRPTPTALLTPRETHIAHASSSSSHIWSLPFTLHRGNLPASCAADWEGEVRGVMAALSHISISPTTATATSGPTAAAAGHSYNRTLTILTSSQCTPRVSFHRAARQPWEPHAVRNAVLLVAAFEREMGVVGTPEGMLGWWPLTHFFVVREVRRVRGERSALWRGVGGDGDVEGKKDGGGRGIRKRRMWERAVREWRGEIERVEEGGRRREALLGVEGAYWWDRVYAMMKGVEGGELVRDMVARTERGKGGRLALGFRVREGGGGEDGEVEHSTRGSLPPSPPLLDAFPEIAEVVLPVPFRSLDASTLLAYIDLLSHILLFAVDGEEDDVYAYVQRAKTDGKRADETPVEGLMRLAEKVRMREEWVAVLRREATRFINDGGVREAVEKEKEKEKGDPFWEIEEYVRRRYEEGRRFVGRWAHDEAEEDRETDAEREEAGREKGGQSVKLNYLERYEYAGGYMVPGGMKVLSLMEADSEAKRKAKVEGATSSRDAGGDATMDLGLPSAFASR